MTAMVQSDGEIDWGAKRYLIVDDFVGIRQLLRESLRNLGARNIDQASSGGEAMGLLGAQGSGSIINLASICGQFGTPWMARLMWLSPRTRRVIQARTEEGI